VRLATTCPACGGNAFRRYPAKVAGFVAERVWNSAPFETRLLRCRDCGTAFYEIRPDDNELARLYAGYRDEAYQRQRQSHEPDYTAECNAVVAGGEEQRIRREHMVSLLVPWIQSESITSVLDFGGDQGQSIPSELSSARRYVHDVSGVEPLPGIESIADVARLREMDFDLVMCCMVLEHVAEPRAIVETLRQIGHAGTLFYFEVPQDSPIFSPSSRLAPDASMALRLKARLQETPFYEVYLRARGAQPA
jgi:hypothetical protein